MCDENIEYKKCIKCDKLKELNTQNFEFRTDRGCYRNTCKECKNLREKEKYDAKKALLPAPIIYIENIDICPCNQCGKEKLFSRENFVFREGKLTKVCRKCKRKTRKIYRDNNKDKINEKKRNYYANNEGYRSWVSDYQKQYNIDYVEKVKIRRKNYYQENREEILAKQKTDEYHAKRNVKGKERRNTDPEFRKKENEACRKYQKEHKDKIKEYNQRPEIKERTNKRARQRRRSDVQLKLKENLRCRLWGAIKTQKGFKTGSTEKLLGCQYEFLMSYLQNKFTEGMSLELLLSGKIVTDHVIPCEAFDLTLESHQLKCFNYKNLQPLWKVDNDKKNDWIMYNGERIRAHTLTKQQKHAYISSLNLPPYEVPNHSAAPYNPLINQIKLDLPIQTFINQEVNNPIIIATNLPIRAPIIRRIDLVS